ncbi:rod shape-determining protein [Catalinimonas niigatensis]|uniref:rod shape-determining protein n=1 Tax=Catalinimonas niigatensis TaxID=1397264 RepID=UPI0026661083|nr:rod shape-determining protein [Catalinimonas niigatensis]WPP50608.1 rod shape-determining protein [Catalinimonas niigatensis]
MFNISLKKGRSLAIDLGNSNTRLTDKEYSCFSQPSFIALQKDKRTVKAVGHEAYNMLGKANGHLKIIKPLKGGVIVDFDSANCMLKSLVKTLYPPSSFFHGFEYVVAGIPFDTTEVERRALRDALEQFKSHRTFLLFEPLAAAIGLGLNIQEPDGKLLVDIGGGVTEIVVISLSGIVSYQSIKIAGDSFDEDIQDYFKKNYNMSIGNKVAEQLKINVGSAIEIDATADNIPQACEVIGKNLMTGLPISKLVDHTEIASILNSSISKIEHAILLALEECQPELAGDIYGNGIHLTGGGSLLRGLKQRLEATTRLQVHHANDPLQSVIQGLSIVMQNPGVYKSVLFQ